MIAYHGTPIGGTRIDSARFLRGRHALVSFANPEAMPIVAEVCASFVLDNGAFTFWRGGKQPDWDEYYRWVNEWATHPGYDWHLIPDIIDGSEDDNWRLMFHYGRKAPYGVPVYHLHESLAHLERMIASFDRVALGSSGQWSTPGTSSWWYRMAEVMNVCCDSKGRPRCRLHGLRMLNHRVFSRLPLSSADSCNAGRNNHESKRFGIYMPPTAAQRAEVIASRIESHNSAPIWIETDEERLVRMSVALSGGAPCA